MKEIKKDNEKKKINFIKKNKNNNSYWEKYKCKKESNVSRETKIVEKNISREII